MTHSERIGFWFLAAFSGLVLAFLTVPILAIVPLSFSSGSLLVYPLPGWSLQWYKAVVSDPQWREAAWNSLVVAGLSTLLATGLGTAAAIGLASKQRRSGGLINMLVLIPMITPVVVSAVGAYFFYAAIGLSGGLTALVFAHTAIGSPFVVVTVSASLQSFDRNLMRAAASLGATPIRAFRSIMLPCIAPGVLSGALFAFATSFDEVVIALFVGGPTERTLPRQILGGIRDSINPSVTAVATLLVIFSTLLLLAMEIMRRRVVAAAQSKVER